MSGHMNRPKGKQSVRSKNRGSSHYPQNYQKHMGIQGNNAADNYGILSNIEAVYIFCKHLMGQIAEVVMRDETIVEGVIRALSPSGDIGLSYALTRPLNGKGKPFKVDKLKILSMSDIKWLIIRGVKPNGGSNDMKIDEEISRPCRAVSNSPEGLHPYFSDTDKPEECELDGHDGFPTSEMFDTNKKLYQISTTYDSSLDGYTVPVDKSQPEFDRLEAHCTELAKKFGNEMNSKAQLDDVADSMLESEESKFSSVARINPTFPQRDQKIDVAPLRGMRVRSIGRGGLEITRRFSHLSLDNSIKSQSSNIRQQAPQLNSTSGSSLGPPSHSGVPVVKSSNTPPKLSNKQDKVVLLDSSPRSDAKSAIPDNKQIADAVSKAPDTVNTPHNEEQVPIEPISPAQNETSEHPSSSLVDNTLEERIKKSTLNPDAPEFKPTYNCLHLCHSRSPVVVLSSGLPVTTVATSLFPASLLPSVPTSIPVSATLPHSTMAMNPAAFYPTGPHHLYPSHVQLPTHPTGLPASISLHHNTAPQAPTGQLNMLAASHAAGLPFPITCNGQSLPAVHPTANAVFSQMFPHQQHSHQGTPFASVLANTLSSQLLPQHMSPHALIAQSPRGQLPAHANYALLSQQQQPQATAKSQQQGGNNIQHQPVQPQSNQAVVGISRQRSTESSMSAGVALPANSSQLFLSSAPQATQFASLSYPVTTSGGAVYPTANASIFPPANYFLHAGNQIQGFHAATAPPVSSAPGGVTVAGSSLQQQQGQTQPPAHSAYITSTMNPTTGLTGITGQPGFSPQMQLNQPTAHQNQAMFSVFCNPHFAALQAQQPQQQQAAMHQYTGFYPSHQQQMPSQQQTTQPPPSQPQHPQHQPQQSSSLSQQQQYFAQQQLQAQAPFALSALGQQLQTQQVFLQHHQSQQQQQQIPGQHHPHHHIPHTHLIHQSQNQQVQTMQPHPAQSANSFSIYTHPFAHTYAAAVAAQVAGQLPPQTGPAAYYAPSHLPTQLQLQQASQAAAVAASTALGVGQPSVPSGVQQLPLQTVQIPHTQPQQSQQTQSNLSVASSAPSAVALVPQTQLQSAASPSTQASGHI